MAEGGFLYQEVYWQLPLQTADHNHILQIWNQCVGAVANSDQTLVFVLVISVISESVVTPMHSN